MGKVTRRQMEPGETMFGGGAGVLTLYRPLSQSPTGSGGRLAPDAGKPEHPPGSSVNEGACGTSSGDENRSNDKEP